MTEKRTLADFTQAATAAAEASRELSRTLSRLDLATARAEQFHGTTATDSSDKADPSVATLADVAQELRPARGV